MRIEIENESCIRGGNRVELAERSLSTEKKDNARTRIENARFRERRQRVGSFAREEIDQSCRFLTFPPDPSSFVLD